MLQGYPNLVCRRYVKILKKESILNYATFSQKYSVERSLGNLEMLGFYSSVENAEIKVLDWGFLGRIKFLIGAILFLPPSM